MRTAKLLTKPKKPPRKGTSAAKPAPTPKRRTARRPPEVAGRGRRVSADDADRIAVDAETARRVLGDDTPRVSGGFRVEAPLVAPTADPNADVSDPGYWDGFRQTLWHVWHGTPRIGPSGYTDGEARDAYRVHHQRAVAEHAAALAVLPPRSMEEIALHAAVVAFAAVEIRGDASPAEVYDTLWVAAGRLADAYRRYNLGDPHVVVAEATAKSVHGVLAAVEAARSAPRWRRDETAVTPSASRGSPAARRR